MNNLGNKQTIVLHNCEINNEAYDLVITPHKQTIGYTRTKRQTIKRKILSKQRQTTRKRFSKRRKAVSESEFSNLDVFCKLKDTINKNYPRSRPIIFFRFRSHITFIKTRKKTNKNDIKK